MKEKRFYRLYPISVVWSIGVADFNSFMIGTPEADIILPYVITMNESFFEDKSIGWRMYHRNHNSGKYVPIQKIAKYVVEVLSTEGIEYRLEKNNLHYYSEVYIEFIERLLVDIEEFKNSLRRMGKWLPDQKLRGVLNKIAEDTKIIIITGK
jgi:hypothetical protein